MLTEFGQGTSSGKLSFRGFNGEGEVNAVKLLIDGIPSNSNDGNMPYLDMLFPLEIDGIEVVRGTNDPRYGLYNIAGNVAVQSRIGGDYGKARLRYGSYDTQELQLAKASKAATGRRTTSSASRRAMATATMPAASAPACPAMVLPPDAGDWRLGLIARHYEAEADEPGYLSREDARHSPRQSYALSASDMGERRMNQLSLHLDSQLASDSAGRPRSGSTPWMTTAGCVSPRPSRNSAHPREALRRARTSLTYRPDVSWLHDLALEGGLDTEQQRNRSERYTTVERQVVTQTRDQRFDYDSYGAYLQAVIQPGIAEDHPGISRRPHSG